MSWKQKAMLEDIEFKHDKQKNPGGMGENWIKLFDFEQDPPEYKFYHIGYAVAGDTDSIYLQLPDKITHELEQEGVDELIGFCDDIGQATNDSFPEFCENAFLVAPDRAKYIQTDREVVSDKSIFVTKKRYQMHIIDDEGKRVDKIKTMGLEIKKSDTAKAEKEILGDILDRVMAGQSREQVEQAISEFKKRYMQMPIDKIGRPKPAGQILKHETAYQLAMDDPENKKLHMKAVPYHIEAALNYNFHATQNDRRLEPGEKFYFFYVKDKRFNSLALPIDAKTVPEWLQNVQIDYNKMWSKANTKITNYLKSIGWDRQSVREDKAKSVFGM